MTTIRPFLSRNTELALLARRAISRRRAPSGDVTRYEIVANGTPLGTYSADSPETALDAFAEDAGYSDYAELASRHGDDARAIK